MAHMTGQQEACPWVHSPIPLSTKSKSTLNQLAMSVLKGVSKLLPSGKQHLLGMSFAAFHQEHLHEIIREFPTPKHSN